MLIRAPESGGRSIAEVPVAVAGPRSLSRARSTSPGADVVSPLDLALVTQRWAARWRCLALRRAGLRTKLRP